MLFFYSHNRGSLEVNARIKQFHLEKEFQYINTGKDPKTNQRSPYCDQYGVRGVPQFYDTRNGARCIGTAKCLDYLGLVAVHKNPQFKQTDHRTTSTNNWQTNNAMDFSTGATSNTPQGHVNPSDVDGLAYMNTTDTDLPEFINHLTPEDYERIKNNDVSALTESDSNNMMSSYDQVMANMSKRRQV